MKKTTLAACTIAALIITCTSCKWFSSNKKQPSIVGKWKIDSLYPTGKDSGSLGYLLFALAKTSKDKDSLGLQFNADSTFAELPIKDSTTKKYYVKDKEIFIQEDSTFKPYVLSFKNDSTVSFLAKDSMLIILKRQ